MSWVNNVLRQSLSNGLFFLAAGSKCLSKDWNTARVKVVVKESSSCHSSFVIPRVNLWPIDREELEDENRRCQCRDKRLRHHWHVISVIFKTSLDCWLVPDELVITSQSYSHESFTLLEIPQTCLCNRRVKTKNTKQHVIESRSRRFHSHIWGATRTLGPWLVITEGRLETENEPLDSERFALSFILISCESSQWLS